MTQSGEHNETIKEVIDLIIDAVNLQHLDKTKIDSETSLTKGGLELDSVDILEVVVVLEQRYGLKVRDSETGRKYFQTIGTIAELILTKTGAN